MREAHLLHELVLLGAERSPDAPALTYGRETLGYGALAATVQAAAGGLAGLGVGRAERVAVYLEKRFEMVAACFAAPAMGGVFVPVNPLTYAVAAYPNVHVIGDSSSVPATDGKGVPKSSG